MQGRGLSVLGRHFTYQCRPRFRAVDLSMGRPGASGWTTRCLVFSMTRIQMISDQIRVSGTALARGGMF